MFAFTVCHIVDKATAQVRCDLFLSHQLCVSRETAAESTKNVLVARVRSSCRVFHLKRFHFLFILRFGSRTETMEHTNQNWDTRDLLLVLLFNRCSPLVSHQMLSQYFYDHNLHSLLYYFGIHRSFAAFLWQFIYLWCQSRTWCALPINTLLVAVVEWRRYFSITFLFVALCPLTESNRLEKKLEKKSLKFARRRAQKNGIELNFSPVPHLPNVDARVNDLGIFCVRFAE